MKIVLPLFLFLNVLTFLPRQGYTQQTQQGPWNSPLMVATSNDGITFAAANIFQDSSGVPSLIRWKGDTLICVFQWFRKPDPSPTWDRVAVKFSYDAGLNWTQPTPLVFRNFPANYQRPFDPTVVTFGKDSLRIYYSSSDGLPQGGLSAIVNTYSAVSADGINFYFEQGARVDDATRPVIDPAITWFKNQWQYTAPRGAPQDGAFHYTSTNGLTFKAEQVIPSDNVHNWTGNLMVDLAGKLRFYGSGSKLWFSSSSDGFSWSSYTDTNLKGGDPSVLQLGSSSYLAIYVGERYGTNPVTIPTLTTKAVSAIGATTASSGGNVSADGGASVTARGVVWSTISSPTVSLTTRTSDGAGTGAFNSALSSLSPNTNYYVRAYATNSAGTAYGNEVSFRTLQTPTLSVTPNSLTFSSSGGSLSLSIRSNASWTVSESLDFITISPSAGTGDGSVTVTCSVNSSSQSRSGNLSVQTSGLPIQEVSIQQAGMPVSSTAVLTADFSRTGKAPKDLLGVNIGPGSSIKGYQEAGIREIRTHDFYGPCDYWQYTVNALDTSAKRFRSTFDPTKESSYNWKDSDAKMDSIVRNGFRPFFRLGISWPNTINVPTFPPLDASGQTFQTFGEISRRTVMHYTKGWHNGFTYPIRHWEIWNEPDFNEKFWSGSQGTPINYFNLYKSASTAIKQVDAQMKVGGPGLAYASLFFKKQGYVTEFMAYCQSNRLPLDFYSWHLYDIRNPQGIKAYADTVRTYLDRYGFTSSESFITEINPDLKGGSFQNNARGAAWVTGAFITCNQAPVDKFFWYRGVQLSPLADPDGPSSGNLLWPGLAYRLYSSFLTENIKTVPVGGEQVITTSFDRDTTSLQALAGQSVSRDTLSLLVSHLNSPSVNLSLQLNQVPWNGSARVILTRLNDPDRRLVITESTAMVEGGRVTLSVGNAATPGTFLLRLVRKQATPIFDFLPSEILEVFPNPASDRLEIMALSDLKGPATCRLIHLNGQILHRETLPGLMAGDRKSLNLSHLPTGMYILQLQTLKGIWNRKVDIVR